jgi:hypothetical protein
MPASEVMKRELNGCEDARFHGDCSCSLSVTQEPHHANVAKSNQLCTHGWPHPNKGLRRDSFECK